MSQQEFLSLLGKLVNEETIKGLSNLSGTKTTQANTAVKTSLPEILQALLNNCKSEEGASSLYSALDDHDGSSLNNIPETIKDSNTQVDGAKILEHIFGSDQSAVVNDVVSKSGISSSQATNILQTISPLLLDTLGKIKQAQGLPQEARQYFEKAK